MGKRQNLLKTSAKPSPDLLWAPVFLLNPKTHPKFDPSSPETILKSFIILPPSPHQTYLEDPFFCPTSFSYSPNCPMSVRAPLGIWLLLMPNLFSHLQSRASEVTRSLLSPSGSISHPQTLIIGWVRDSPRSSIEQNLISRAAAHIQKEKETVRGRLGNMEDLVNGG